MKPRYVALSEGKAKIHLVKEDRKTRVREVLWGDYLHVDKDMGDGWLRVLWAPDTDRQELFIRKEHTSTERPLEIIFVDVGQGDGAVLITPEHDRSERVMVIDAGERGNMGWFLNDRFKSYDSGFDFHAAVITHPDQDHYQGFVPIFESDKTGFDVVYHSGLIERPVKGTWDKLGTRTKTKDPVTKKRYLTDLAIDDVAIKSAFGDEQKNGAFFFPKVMHAALRNKGVKKFRMLSTEHGRKVDGRSYVPGFSPTDSNPAGYTIEVLGPVVEFDRQGRPRLRVIGDYGETKNGHSVLLKLTFGGFRVFFGGDLNEPAERFLLTHYAGLDAFPKEGTLAHQDMVADASKVFRSDVMKVCHHGSEKVTDAFLAAVNPAAFIISSGDEEGHVHPRPDLLGRLGRMGRGPAPVLLSTELQRSTRDLEDEKVMKRLSANTKAVAKKATPALEAKVAEDISLLGRANVAVWGTIYVKTDGRRLIAAFKKESGSDKDKWFYFEYGLDDSGELKLIG